jgi:hypothetical protein
MTDEFDSGTALTSRSAPKRTHTMSFDPRKFRPIIVTFPPPFTVDCDGDTNNTSGSPAY